MSYMKEVYDFAVKWRKKFSSQNPDCMELIGSALPDDCEKLDFIMDSGKSFTQKYADAYGYYEKLKDVIDSIDDIPLLGSAIYSKWRYYNHWAYSAGEILEAESLNWFILAFSRLAELSDKGSMSFVGELEKIEITTNKLYSPSILRSGTEIEQHITIDKNGVALFSGFNYTGPNSNPTVGRKTQISVDSNILEMIFDIFTTLFSYGYTENQTDGSTGNWRLVLTNVHGHKYKFCGALSDNSSSKGPSISNLIREALGMDDLFVFDGNTLPNRIDKITFSHCCPSESGDGLPWSENLVIDRSSQTIEYSWNYKSGYSVSHTYRLNDEIGNLLDKFDPRIFFTTISGTIKSTTVQSDSENSYTVSIVYNNCLGRVISGTFDKTGLPQDFPYFSKEVYRLIKNFFSGDMFDPSVYSAVSRHTSSYIYCKVMFEENGKSYYYITDDETINIGDLVVVPAGPDNAESVVKVVDIHRYSIEDVPFPVEKTKRILRKLESKDT